MHFFKLVFSLVILLVNLSLSSIFNISYANNYTYQYSYLNLNLTEEESNLIKTLQESPINVAIFSENGIDKFVINNLIDTFGFKFNIVRFPKFADAYEAVKNGDVAILANISLTDERERFFDFSIPISFDTHILYSYRSGNFISYADNNRIGVEKGTIWVELAKQNFPESEIIEVFSKEEAYKKIQNNEIDFIFGNNNYYEYLVMQDLNAIILDDKINLIPSNVAATKNKHKTLLSIISKYSRTPYFIDLQDKFKKEYIHKIDEIYLSKKIKESNLDKDIIYRIHANENPPFVIFNKNKIETGIFIDVIHEVFKKLGLKYEIVSDYSNIDDYLGDFNSMNGSKELNSDIDIILPVLKNSRYSNINYSKAIVKTKNVIIKRADYISNYNNIGELLYEIIGTYSNGMDPDFYTLMYSNQKIKNYNTFIEAINGLKNGETNFVAINEVTFDHYVKSTNDLSVRIDSKIDPYSYSDFRLAYNNNTITKDLKALIDIAIKEIDEAKIMEKYIVKIDYEEYYQNQTKTVYVLLGICIFILIMLLILRNNLRKLMRTDELCSIYNRFALFQDYPKGINYNNTLIYFNINNFNIFNETYGHLIGDEILKNFAISYQGYEKFKVYRVGGDEFVVISNFNNKDITIDEYINLFIEQNIKVSTGAIYKIKSNAIIIPGSLSINSTDELLGMINITKHDNKTKDSKVYLDNNSIIEYSNRLIFRDNLKKALSEKEITSHFQPVIDIMTGKIIGIEVLARWKKNNSFIPVGLFLKEAKVIGREGSIDEVSLSSAEKVYSLLKNEKLESNIYISVNMSGQTLSNIGIRKVILEKYAIPKNVLILEVLEDVVLDSNSLTNLDTIIDSGYSVAIDDFGAGNTSLRYMKEPRFGIIKIDRTLVPNFDDNACTQASAVFESQIAMLRKLDKVIIVEGVEKIAQVEYLRTLKVKNVQGYYYAKPMPMDELIELIRKTNVSHSQIVPAV